MVVGPDPGPSAKAEGCPKGVPRCPSVVRPRCLCPGYDAGNGLVCDQPEDFVQLLGKAGRPTIRPPPRRPWASIYLESRVTLRRRFLLMMSSQCLGLDFANANTGFLFLCSNARSYVRSVRPLLVAIPFVPSSFRVTLGTLDFHPAAA